MPLNNTATDPGYICGRLTAAYEIVAEQVGRQLPINDLNLSATNPMHVLPRLRAGLVSEALARLRTDNPQAVRRVEDYIAELTDHLDEFPRQLTLTERSRYVLGHAHQRIAGLPGMPLPAAEARGADADTP